MGVRVGYSQKRSCDEQQTTKMKYLRLGIRITRRNKITNEEIIGTGTIKENDKEKSIEAVWRIRKYEQE